MTSPSAHRSQIRIVAHDAFTELRPAPRVALNGVAYYIIWLGVPLLVADSISREKREGTLGLLFLTPLSATDLVAGKGMILGLRGLNLLVIPVGLLWRVVAQVNGFWREEPATTDRSVTSRPAAATRC